MTAVARAARALWDALFGPPRIRQLADGTLRVRLLGRTFEARDHDALLDSVSRDRERLLTGLNRLHERGPESGMAGSRYNPGELHHRETARLQERLRVYNDFIGYLLRQAECPGCPAA